MRTTRQERPLRGLRASVESFLNARWYGRAGVLRLLIPFEWLYGLIAYWRRGRAIHARQQSDLLQSSNSRIPTIVVGNLVAGGTGKTPVVVEVVRELVAQGVRPGIVARGYGGKARSWPRLVSAPYNPQLCGDEACELAILTGCPVVVGPDRAAAARWLVELMHCQVVVSDDGLQHYRLARDLELVLVHAQRCFGNGHRLPVGPLREPPERLRDADMTLITGSSTRPDQAVAARELISELGLSPAAPVLEVALLPARARLLLAAADAQTLPASQAPFAGEPVIALSSIAAPERFHADLCGLGCEVLPRVLADHQSYDGFVADWPAERWVVTTGKDAVKLVWALINNKHEAAGISPAWLEQVWVLDRRVELSAADRARFRQVLTEFVDMAKSSSTPTEPDSDTDSHTDSHTEKDQSSS